LFFLARRGGEEGTWPEGLEKQKRRIAGTRCIRQFYRVKRMIRGLRVETTLTYSQTLNR
jgi:hypothetical protein